MYLHLTTTGRVTGQAREIGAWRALLPCCRARERQPGAQHPVAAALVKVRVGDAEFNAIARVVHNGREPQLGATVKALFDAKYGWSDGLIVALTPA
jgi:hypothetical protein